jgi:hypothetical protein
MFLYTVYKQLIRYGDSEDMKHTVERGQTRRG